MLECIAYKYELWPQIKALAPTFPNLLIECLANIESDESGVCAIIPSGTETDDKEESSWPHVLHVEPWRTANVIMTHTSHLRRNLRLPNMTQLHCWEVRFVAYFSMRY